MSDGPEFLTEEQVAKRWGTSLHQVRQARKAGLLPFHQLGRLIRYTDEDLAEHRERSRASSFQRSAPKRKPRK